MRTKGTLAAGMLFALAVGLVWAPRAQGFGCQASGSLPIFPDAGTTCPTALHLGDLVDIQITTTNTSSSTPPGTSVAAKLVNVCVGGANAGAECTLPGDCTSGVCGAAIVYTLACTNTACSAELPGTLTFVPVGGNGCVSNAAAVTGCALNADDPTGNKIDITVDAVGVPLPGGATNVAIATIRAQATAEVPFSLLNPCGQFGTRADTSGNSIVTTDAQCDAVATGGAQGSTNLFLPQPTATPTETPIPTETPTPTETAVETPTATASETPTETPTETATPTATVEPTPTFTDGPTPTSTASPNGNVHYQCYEIHQGPVTPIAVSLNDVFGDGNVTVRRAKRICNPADKNDEDPDAVTAIDHLKAYEIDQSNKFATVKHLDVTNQFGSARINLLRPDYIMVPTAKSLIAIPPPIVPTINHYKCYSLGNTKLRVSGLKIDDQFGTLNVDITHPMRFCAAADKNGEGIIDPDAHLLCYRERAAAGSPRFKGPLIFTNNQFGTATNRVYGPRELCVPTTIVVD